MRRFWHRELRRCSVPKGRLMPAGECVPRVVFPAAVRGDAVWIQPGLKYPPKLSPGTLPGVVKSIPQRCQEQTSAA
jgi:hypothetical protein